MKPLRALLTLLACAGACAAQEARARQDAPPGLAVLRLKWERQPDLSRRVRRPAQDLGRTASDPDALNNPGGLQTTAGGPPLPYVYQYSVEVRNDHAKGIRWVSWEYVLSEPGGGRELGRHRFGGPAKVGTGRKKTLRGRTPSAPTRVVSAARAGRGKESPHEERVEFRCVAYDDGTWWHRPSVRESECVEASEQGQK